MPAIGLVTKNEKGGYSGMLNTLTINAPINFIPIKEKHSERSPDFHIYSGKAEVGAAWIRTGRESGREYVSACFSAPEFGTRKIHANLGRAAGQDDPDVFALIWNDEE
jgi:uncharacterized protein (DUF736 family)